MSNPNARCKGLKNKDDIFLFKKQVYRCFPNPVSKSKEYKISIKTLCVNKSEKYILTKLKKFYKKKAI